MGNDKNITLVNNNDLNDYNEIDLLCAFELDYSGKIVYRGSKQYIQNVVKEEYDKIKEIIKRMIDYNCEVSNV